MKNVRESPGLHVPVTAVQLVESPVYATYALLACGRAQPPLPGFPLGFPPGFPEVPMVMLDVYVSVASPPVSFSVTGYVPAVLYVCVGDRSVDVPPSPNV